MSAEYRPLPRLAAGVRVIIRGRRELQIGLMPGRSVVVPRTAATTDLLRALERGEALDQRGDLLLARLQAAGLLHAPDTGTSLRLAVEGDLPALGVLALAGLKIVPVHEATAVLVLSSGELARERVDRLIRQRIPHLVLRCIDGATVIGPFVVPGQTACLRCIDAHHCDRDPEYAGVVDAYVRATSRARRDGADEVADPSAVVLALAWAAHDLKAWASGRTPLTWSTTLTTENAGLEATLWRPHPQCGCHWVPGVSVA